MTTPAPADGSETGEVRVSPYRAQYHDSVAAFITMHAFGTEYRDELELVRSCDSGWIAHVGAGGGGIVGVLLLQGTHVRSLAVMERCRRRGIARLLCNALLASPLGQHPLTLALDRQWRYYMLLHARVARAGFHCADEACEGGSELWRRFPRSDVGPSGDDEPM